MGLLKRLDLADMVSIDWEMTPEYTFGTFESWGGKERVRNKKERIYYFFIDNWGETPKLCLMERGIKHARIVAEILAPQQMVEECVRKQGIAVFDKNFSINKELEQWLLENVLEGDDASKIIPIAEEIKEHSWPSGLPGRDAPHPEIRRILLPDSYMEISEEEVTALIRKYNLFDSDQNERGDFPGFLIDNGDNLTISDMASGLMWQRSGIDIMSHRQMKQEIERINQDRFAGFSDWRLPSIAEALSLMTKEKNNQGLHLHPCFSTLQPFIFVNAIRKPGGYWFVDYKQARTFWASGTIPGGFGRLCRRENA